MFLDILFLFYSDICLRNCWSCNLCYLFVHIYAMFTFNICHVSENTDHFLDLVRFTRTKVRNQRGTWWRPTWVTTSLLTPLKATVSVYLCPVALPRDEACLAVYGTFGAKVYFLQHNQLPCQRKRFQGSSRSKASSLYRLTGDSVPDFGAGRDHPLQQTWTPTSRAL